MGERRTNEVWWPEDDALTANYPEVTGDVYRLIRNDYPRLLHPDPSGPHELTPETRLKLQESVIALNRAQSDPFVAFRYLAEAIDRGNRREWFQILPPFVWMDIKREPSPFLPPRQKDELKAVRLARALRCDIQSGQRVDSPGIAAGRILLSLVAHSAVIITKLLQGLPQALDDAGNRIATEPWVEVRADSGELWRRVFIDPLTRCLVMDFHVRFGALLDHLAPRDDLDRDRYEGTVVRRCRNDMMQRRLAWYLGYAAGPDTIAKPSVSNLIRLFHARLHKQLPGFLVSYASGHYDAASLPADNFLRLVNDRFYASTERASIEETPESAVTALFSRSSRKGHNDDLEARSTSLAMLYRTLSEYERLTKEQARQRIEQWRQHELAPGDFLAQRLGGWAYDLLRRKRNRSPRQPSTVYGMMTTIGRRLEQSLNRRDPVDLAEAIVYEEMYRTILDSADTRQLRRKIGVALYSFHEYLRREHGVIELEADIFDLSGSVKGQADARIVTEVEINRVDGLIEQGSGDWMLRRCLNIILHLGFYCGMRRGEIAQLRVGDINGLHELWIFIRPWKNQKLKTRNSIRRSPAAHLLPDDTAMALIELKKWRLNSGAGLYDPLWPLTDAAEHNDPQQLIDAVVGMVQSTIGDTSFRFHHLRHSFATRLVLWHWHQANEGRIRFPGWFNTLREGGKRATRPFLAGRNFLFPISEAMGHGSIEVTLENYVHLMDVMLGLAMRQQVPQIKRAFVEGVMDVRISRAAEIKEHRENTWEAYEDVLFALGKKPGRPPKRQHVLENPLSGSNSLYGQAVMSQEKARQPWPIPNMVVDWPMVKDLCAGCDMSLAASKIYAPLDRALAMAEVVNELPDHRVLLRSGVKTGTDYDGVPDLNGDILKGVQRWAAQLNRKQIREKALSDAADLYVRGWVANTRTAVAVDNLKDYRLMTRVFSQLTGDPQLLTCSHQPDPGSLLEAQDQRGLWESKGINLVEKSRPERRMGTEAGMLVVDLDTSQWNRSQTTQLVGLRLLMVYLAMIGSQG